MDSRSRRCALCLFFWDLRILDVRATSHYGSRLVTVSSATTDIVGYETITTAYWVNCTQFLGVRAGARVAIF